MTEIRGPRLLEPDEFDELMAMLDRCFAYERGGMAAHLPFVYDRERPERHAVITVDGDVVSHAARVPETLSIGEDATVECGGIGGVATAKPHRGNGYMSQLLEFWLERMAANDLPLSELGGNRERYGHFGWERAGREVAYSITERSAPDASIDADVGIYDGAESDLESIRRLRRREPLRIERGRELARTVYGRRDLETLLYRDDGEVRAYLCLSRGSRERSIREFGGDSDGVEALLAHLFEWYDVESATAYVHPNHARNDLFGRISSRWRTRPPRLLNVRDLPALLEAYADPLDRRWKRRAFAAEGDLVLAIEGDGDAVRLAHDRDGIAIEPCDAEPDLSLDRRAMTRLLFGGDGRAEVTKGRHPVLRALLPLEYYVWHTEYV